MQWIYAPFIGVLEQVLNLTHAHVAADRSTAPSAGSQDSTADPPSGLSAFFLWLFFWYVLGRYSVP
jgi:hypothetical protein